MDSIFVFCSLLSRVQATMICFPILDHFVNMTHLIELPSYCIIFSSGCSSHLLVVWKMVVRGFVGIGLLGLDVKWSGNMEANTDKCMKDTG